MVNQSTPHVDRIGGAPGAVRPLGRVEFVKAALGVCCLLGFVVPVLAAGESESSPADTQPATDTQPAANPPAVQVVGHSLGGRAIRCHVFGTGPETVLIIATIHGNEASGTPLVDALGAWLESHPGELAGRRVVVMPVANPDGMLANTRFNAGDVDLNRNFPAGNWGHADQKPPGATPLSEPESRVLMRVVCEYYPDRVVSIHQPLACIDYDGPAKRLAEAMAASCELPVKKLGSRPGSLGSFVGVTLGKPIITLELPREAGMDREVLWRKYGQALLAAIRFSDLP